MDPVGRNEARAALNEVCGQVPRKKRLALVGFSQGGMLAMDYVLHGGRVDALALLSSTRIAFEEWRPLLPRLSGLPVLIAHGRDDEELAFAAGEALRDAAAAGGARVTWLPFDGGHGIPLPAWRGLRRFLQGLE
jgi:phospholipase/carboxylesterase